MELLVGTCAVITCSTFGADVVDNMFPKMNLRKIPVRLQIGSVNLPEIFEIILRSNINVPIIINNIYSAKTNLQFLVEDE